MTRLAFASTPQAIETGTCSAPVIIETRNMLGVATTVATSTTVAFNSTPGTTAVYLGPGCLGAPVSFGVIPAGQSQVRFSMRAATPLSYTLTAAAPPLSLATQSLIVFQVPTQLAFIASLPMPLRAGSCFPATVEARGPLSLPIAVQSDTPVALTTSILNGTLFFADPTCTVPTTSGSIGVGSSVATVYVKPLSGVPQVLSATASFGTGTLSISPVPIVRRGVCTVRGSAEFCPIDSAMVPATPGRSFLITQSLSATGTATPLDVEARCRLQGTEINCVRRGGTGLTSDALTHFQVVELPTGLTVQAASSGSCQAFINLPGMVDPSRTFLLKSVVGSGTNFDRDDSVSVTLSGPTTVAMSSGACDGYEVQAVDWEGVTVTRSVSSIPNGALSALSPMLPPSSPATLVLSQPSNDSLSTSAPCPFLGRAEVFSPSELRFSRGNNRTLCNLAPLPRIVWERIDFGTRARVWPYTAALTPNTQTAMVSITPVDPTRSFVITSSQQLGGQGSGESDALGSADVVDAAVQTRLVNINPFTASSVDVARQASNSAAFITFYVVQIDP